MIRLIYLRLLKNKRDNKNLRFEINDLKSKVFILFTFTKSEPVYPAQATSHHLGEYQMLGRNR